MAKRKSLLARLAESKSVPWWEAIDRCTAVIYTANGQRRCRNKAMRPFERRPGDLIIPLHCWHHATVDERQATR